MTKKNIFKNTTQPNQDTHTYIFMYNLTQQHYLEHPYKEREKYTKKTTTTTYKQISLFSELHSIE